MFTVEDGNKDPLGSYHGHDDDDDGAGELWSRAVHHLSLRRTQQHALRPLRLWVPPSPCLCHAPWVHSGIKEEKERQKEKKKEVVIKQYTRIPQTLQREQR